MAPLPASRTVESGIPLPQYGDNAVSSTKYTWLNLIPKALWNQFRRLSNFYFLIVAVISFIPDISPSSPVTTTLPLLVVIGFGLARDIYEDFLRHRADAVSNNRPVMIRRPRPGTTHPSLRKSAVPTDVDGSTDDAYARILREGVLPPEEYVVVRSADVTVGDVILITDDMHVPADAVVVQSAMSSHECFVSTANLDGESNLKRRYVPSVVSREEQQVQHQQQHDPSASNILNDINNNDNGIDNNQGNDNDDNDEIIGDDSDITGTTGTENNNNINDSPPTSGEKNTLNQIDTSNNNNNNSEDDTIFKLQQQQQIPADDIDNEYLHSIAIDMAAPIPSLYDVHGTLRRVTTETTSTSVSLDDRNILLRGSVLRNSGYVHAVVVYVGSDTKLVQNMRDPPSKLGGVEKTMNLVVIALFVVLLLLTAVTATLAGVYQTQSGEQQWYMGENRFLSGSTVGFRSLGTFIILYHTFVPVSLFVTLEFVRMIQGFFIGADTEMKAVDTDNMGVNVKANNLNETLGYVDHVFSDKTGTLTQNIMRFAACAVPSVRIESGSGVDNLDIDLDIDDVDIEDLSVQNQNFNNDDTDEEQREFEVFDVRDNEDALRNAVLDSSSTSISVSSGARDLVIAMALTHDIVPAHVPGHDHVEYQGESSDEVALVEGARKAGVTLLRRGTKTIYLSTMNDDEDALLSQNINDNESKVSETVLTYQIIAMFEFTSERKRMTVVLKCPDGLVRVFCKGADSVICQLLTGRNTQRVAHAASDKLSRDGLRTLVYGMRVLDNENFVNEWVKRYQAATKVMTDRKNAVAQVAKEVENHLVLLGVTAVEDRLQRDVPETVVRLRDAGVRIWVLTGDKVETAENIGYASHLLSRSMRVETISAEAARKTMQKMDDETEVELLAARVREFAKGIDGGDALGDGRGDERKTPVRVLKDRLRDNDDIERDEEHALIIDGKALNIVLGMSTKNQSGAGRETKPITTTSSILPTAADTERLRSNFVDVALKCKTVICARVTPLQKAEVVRLVRQHQKHRRKEKQTKEQQQEQEQENGGHKCTTLAIGDGGNDVSMIQEADIGIGIRGREGTQAARAADYALGEFRHLWRLLCVHGRFSYVRTTGVINLSLYKNVMFSCTQFLFQFFCFASGTTLHNQWVVTSWNAILTLFPPFLYGLFERDIEIRTAMRVPKAYAVYRTRRLFGLRSVGEFCGAYGVWHANALFWLVFAVFGRAPVVPFRDGKDAGFYLVGVVTSVLAVCTALSKFLLVSHVWSWPVLIGIFGSFALMWALFALYVPLFHELPLEGMLSALFRAETFHMLWPVAFVLIFFPDFMVKLRRAARKDFVEQLQMLEVRNKLM